MIGNNQIMLSLFNKKINKQNNNKYDELEFMPSESDLVTQRTTISSRIKDVKLLFPHCLCTFHDETQRNFLYCNDEQVRKIPDFKSIYEFFNRKCTLD